MTILYNKKYLKQFRRDLRKRMTRSETILWTKLRGKQLGEKFHRQYSVGKYIVDFCSPRAKIAIELDGITHNEEKTYLRDKQKEQFLKHCGFKVLHFSDNDAVNRTTEVVEAIYQICALNNK